MMQVPTNATRRLPQRHQKKQQRSDIKINASVLLLSIVLFADKPDVALGWVHNARYLGAQQHQQQAGASSATPNPAVHARTTPPLARKQRMLNMVPAPRARRSGPRFPSRLVGAAGTEPGKTFEAPVVEGAVVGQAGVVSMSAGNSAVVARDRADQTKEWGAKALWREAMEQLDKERRGGRKPVSGLLQSLEALQQQPGSFGAVGVHREQCCRLVHLKLGVALRQGLYPWKSSWYSSTLIRRL